MKTYKNILVAFVLFGINYLFTDTLFAQCDNCNHVYIIFYGTDVKVPAPVVQNGPEMDAWKSLKHAYLHFKSGFKAGESKADCIKMTDGGFINAESSTNQGEITGGFIPPAGTIVNASFSDYIFVEWIDGSPGNYTYTVQLEAAVSREVIKTATRSFSSLKELGDISTLAETMGKEEFHPLFDIIRQFEKDKRDLKTDVALKAEKIDVFPSQESAKVDEEVDIKFVLVDCDNVPLKNRRIYLNGGEYYGEKLPSSTSGYFDRQYVYTDDNGEAEATFKIINTGEREAYIPVYSPLKSPNGHEGFCVKGETRIKIEKPIDTLTGEIISIEKFYTLRKANGSVNYEQTSEVITKSQIDLKICRGCIERLQDMETFNQIASGNTVYPILFGRTKVDEAGEPTRLTSEGKITEKGIKNNKLVLTEESSFNSSTNGCDWSISIAPCNITASGVAALSTAYCMKSSMTGNIRYHTGGGKYSSEGECKGVRMPQGSDKLESFTEKYGFSGIPNFSYTQPKQTEEEIIVPLIIDNPKALEEYLLDPKSVYEITLHGEKHTNYGNDHTDYDVTITLRVVPKGKLIPLHDMNK